MNNTLVPGKRRERYRACRQFSSKNHYSRDFPRKKKRKKINGANNSFKFRPRR